MPVPMPGTKDLQDKMYPEVNTRNRCCILSFTALHIGFAWRAGFTVAVDAQKRSQMLRIVLRSERPKLRAGTADNAKTIVLQRLR
jgi:hypothetical protein